MGDQPLTSRTAFLWTGAIALVVVVATVTAFVIVLFFGNDQGASGPAEATGTPTSVTTAVQLRSGPAGDTAINGNLLAGTPVRVIGRDDDGDWIFVEVAGPPTIRGWVQAASLAPPPDLAALTISTPEPPLAGSPSATVTVPNVAPTFTPDLPDLAIQSVFSRDNRVVVVVTNVGVVDVLAEITVAIDGGSPRTGDVKPGEPLRPDDQLEIVLDDEYVQRRALIGIEVSTEPLIEETDVDNNSLETVISPDVPNDLGIESAAFDGPETALRVVISNNSTIPVTGSATLTVRENTEERTRLGVAQPLLELAPGETVSVEFPDIVDFTIDEIAIRLSSDAVNDADLTNNGFPR